MGTDHTTQLRGVSDITKVNLTGLVEENVREFFRWAFLDAGNFVEVPVRTPGTADPYGEEVLTAAHQEGVADGRVWQAANADWVYESGFVSGAAPTVASGVYVGGVLYPTASTTGTYAHRLDFVDGSVTFAAAIPTTSLVQVAHSYCRVNVFDEQVPWFRPVVIDAALTEEKQAGGVLGLLDVYRVKPPVVVVEVPTACRQVPYELGSFRQWVHQDVLFHVVAADKATRDAVADAIKFQVDAPFFLYDPNLRQAAGDYPLDAYGSPAPRASMYPAAIQPPPSGYRWNSAYFERMAASNPPLRLPLYQATVRGSLVVDFTSL